MGPLKPCPSGHENNCKIELWGDWFAAACQEKGCGWQTGFHATEGDARRAWNTRHLDQERAELVEALINCREALRDNLSKYAYKNEGIMLSAFNSAESALKKAGVQD